MAIYRRARTPGASYFFTVCTHHRLAVLTEPSYYRALKETFRTVKQRYPFEIDAFVLLPDHLHCIWTLAESDADYAMRWSLIKRLVSQKTCDLHRGPISASQFKRRELGVWQRRFWEHQIRDDRDFETHTDYIHWNPVKHGHVRAVVDWPYSSFHRHVAKGVYPADWGGVDPCEEEARCFGEPA